MEERLQTAAARVASILRTRSETVAIAESSAGGLISAALLAQPGASAYFRGGTVVYTSDAKRLTLHLPPERLAEPRAATEAHALILARSVRDLLDATWGIGETGAAGPTGNRYGDPAGHSCIGIAGPREQARTLRTGQSERLTNMVDFAVAALDQLGDCADTESAR